MKGAYEMGNERRVLTITESLSNAAQRANLLATEADSAQTAELALIVARIALETAAIARLVLDGGTPHGHAKESVR